MCQNFANKYDRVPLYLYTIMSNIQHDECSTLGVLAYQCKFVGCAISINTNVPFSARSVLSLLRHMRASQSAPLSAAGDSWLAAAAADEGHPDGGWSAQVVNLLLGGRRWETPGWLRGPVTSDAIRAFAALIRRARDAMRCEAMHGIPQDRDLPGKLVYISHLGNSPSWA